ncbi:MAG: M20/M25/M40 family metallo-hydrolase [Rhodospirillaceae bacterium]|nr:M20/M25/M40 family metallo-hydrolase [Rhodospirillaceae bacterium]
MSADDTMLDWIDAAHARQIGFLAELVKVPSDNPPGDCVPHATHAAALLEAMGFAVERHPVPAALAQANGMIGAINLVIRQRFGPGPTVALNAHGDVVPPGDGWTVDPYGAVVREGWMYGRGVAVSKSDFATYAFALQALAAAGQARGAVELHFTYDEEAGGAIGPQWLLAEGITKPDFALSAGFSYAVTTAHNGCLHLEATVRGKSAHAARPETGHDALEAATRILTALYALRKNFAGTVSAIPGIGSPNLTVGLIKGGINTNVVPDLVVFRLDRRMIPEESAAEVEAALRAEIAAAAAPLPGITVEIRRVMLAAPLVPLPGHEVLVEALSAGARRILGKEVPAEGVPLYTDARHYSAAGIPTVLYGAGPRSLTEANAHRADERLKLDDLLKATKVVALALRQILAR